LDYAGAGQSLEMVAAEMPNVVVCKSLSKVYALSGARAAYLCANPRLLEPLRPLTPPWAVSLPAQIAAVRALQETDYYATQHRQTVALRNRLTDGLREAIPGLVVLPSVANFLLCFLPEGGRGLDEFLHDCASDGLFLRDVRSMGTQLGERALRVAVKDVETQGRMLEIMGRRWKEPGTK
jgi:histidinol-phosphate/aromatic aminotransferase/cobyric acid decarboxylase-like protein